MMIGMRASNRDPDGGGVDSAPAYSGPCAWPRPGEKILEIGYLQKVIPPQREEPPSVDWVAVLHDEG